MVMKSWPKIFFEVCSLDEWSRFRPEGYCAVVVPSVPGNIYDTQRSNILYT